MTFKIWICFILCIATVIPLRAEQMSSLSDQEIFELIKDIQKGPQGNRNRAIEKLKHLQDIRAYKAIFTMAKDSSPNMSAIGIWALSLLCPVGADGVILEKLNHESAIVRSAATNALGTMGTTRYAKKLFLKLKDPDQFVRAAAIHSFSMFGKKGVPWLAKAVWMRSEVALITLDVLAHSSDKRAIEILKKAAKYGRTIIRVNAAKILAQKNNFIGIKMLCHLLKYSQDKGVRLQAANALGKDTSDFGEQTLKQVIKDKDIQIRQAVVDALEQRKNN